MDALQTTAASGQCCSTNRVLLCTCARAEVISEDARAGVRSALEEMDVDVVIVDDLCAMAAERDPRLPGLVAARPLTIVACYPRAVRWLLNAAEIEIAEDEVTVLNLRNHTPEEIVSELESNLCVREENSVRVVEQDQGWYPWYPVIDYDRCDGCRQCASFCLFGVFATTEEGRVEVVNPAACKANCPACARVCPTGAIIFPKIAESPINGDVITDSTPLGANLQIDMAKMLGDDPLAALARRRKVARQRLLRREAVARAETERERCSCTASPVAPGRQLPTAGGVELPCCPGSSTSQCGES